MQVSSTDAVATCYAQKTDVLLSVVRDNQSNAVLSDLKIVSSISEYW